MARTTARALVALSACAVIGCAPAPPRPATPLVVIPVAPDADTPPPPPAARRAPAPAIASPPAPPSAKPLSAEEALARIPILGTNSDPDGLQSVEALHVAGRAAVPLLIQELEVIDPDHWGEHGMHVIWCIRALRSLTGQDFTFRTSMALSASAATFLDAKKPLPYFAEWMSRARIYVAPRDVQAKVIAAWKRWFRANGQSFAVQKYDTRLDWYF